VQQGAFSSARDPVVGGGGGLIRAPAGETTEYRTKPPSPKEILAVERVFWERRQALKPGGRACKYAGFVRVTVTTLEPFRYKHLYRIFQPGPSPTPEFPAKCGVPGGRFS
jgi:hypothetical protein